MRDRHHQLKIQSRFFKHILAGNKKFEIRQCVDRVFKNNDLCTFKEYEDKQFTGREIGPVRICYVYNGGNFGLAEDYCVFSWEPHQTGGMSESI